MKLTPFPIREIECQYILYHAAKTVIGDDDFF